MTTAGFSGFTSATFEFLGDLSKNNSKEWFEGNRDRYDAVWKKPAFELITSLAGNMAGLPMSLKAEARVNGSLRRINRDVRFSKDKSPYNPRIHLIFWAGAHPNRSPAFHFVLHADRIGFGAGAFGYDGAGLKSLRDRISNKKERAVLLDAIAMAEDLGCEFGETDLIKLPRGYEADTDWEHLLRRKSIVLRTMKNAGVKNDGVPEWICTDQATSRIAAQAKALNPLLQWLAG